VILVCVAVIVNVFEYTNVIVFVKVGVAEKTICVGVEIFGCDGSVFFLQEKTNNKTTIKTIIKEIYLFFINYPP